MPPITFQVQLPFTTAKILCKSMSHCNSGKLEREAEHQTARLSSATLRTQPAFTAQTIPPLATIQLSSNALQTKAHFTPQSELSATIYASSSPTCKNSRSPQICLVCVARISEFVHSQKEESLSAAYVFIDNTTVLQFANSDSEKKKLVDESHNNQLNMTDRRKEKVCFHLTFEDIPSSGPSSPTPSLHRRHHHQFHHRRLHSSLPQEFTYMKNEYEIAAWVSDHKRILDLAISIRKAKRQRIDDDSEDDNVGKMIGNNRVGTLVI
ncbi:3368_t:CDS:2 [Paraglomus occultum]|uniref:3368_t:CDS:1 n=1 Tax=Paraglomus occultum TaxID=144539 RepID=A0A9N9FQ44_9GLOM|nr:3368_t:CDS:2 [Paraglomus occultum]